MEKQKNRHDYDAASVTVSESAMGVDGENGSKRVANAIKVLHGKLLSLYSISVAKEEKPFLWSPFGDATKNQENERLALLRTAIGAIDTAFTG